MKLNKKLLILVLSLVMLVGIVTVSALAADDGVLTIKYQDGTVQTYAEGETIVPPAVPAEFVGYDADGKAYLYTTTGTAWEGLPEAVTSDLLGTTVEATVAATKGADQIFYSVATGSATAAPVYKTTNNVHQFFAPANCKSSVWVKLYADVKADSFSTGTDSSGYYAYLDLNGHSVSVKNSMKVTYTATFYIYSSKPGAHFYSAAPDRMIWADSNGQFALGDDGSGNYVDNISFHTKVIANYIWANGGHVIGGHYYQTEAGLAFLDIGRRMKTVKNAKFYLAPGTTAVFANDATFTAAGLENAYITKGESTVMNCEFYSAEPAAVLYSTASASVKFSDCKFFGVSPTNAGTTGSIAQNANSVEGDAVEYNTVTFPNGVTEFYVANSLEDAKAYVETHPYFMVGNVAPYFVEDGGKYYYVEAPDLSISYDEDFNAIFVENAPRVQVYFTVEKDGAIIQFETDSANYAKNLQSYLTAMTAGATVRLWSDATISACNPKGARLDDASVVTSASYWLDINGYKLTISGSGYAMNIQTYNFYIYSSKAGGEIDASSCSHFFMSNNDEYKNSAGETIKPAAIVYIGEPSATPNVYGKNLTVYCKTVAGTLYGTGAYFLGGTFVQVGSTDFLFNPVQRVQASIKYTTFIAAAGSAGIVAPSNNNTFEYCTFICETPVNAPVVAANCASNMAFKNCNFVNVIPVYPAGVTMTYENCLFGATDVLASENLNSAGAAYLAHGTTAKTVTANGKTYVVDGAIAADLSGVLVVTWHDGKTENFSIGASVYREYDMVDFEEKTLNRNPVYAFSAGVTSGVVTAAGTATATIESYMLTDPFAFTYLDTKTNKIYAVGYNLDCGGTPEGVFEQFYALFSNPASAYEITMYMDMTVTKAMGFGPLVANADSSHNRDYYNTAANGSIVWDLNGTTVTISKDIAGLINLAAANFALATPNVPNGYKPAVFGFEGGSSAKANTFTLKSSVAGGKIVNEASAALFGQGEGAFTKIIFEGENLTIVSENARILSSVEMNRDNNQLTGEDLYRFVVNGGTYIGGADRVFHISMSAKLNGATIVSTNASTTAVVSQDGYRVGTIEVSDCIFVAASPSALAYSAGSSNATHLTFTDCAFIGCVPTNMAACASLTSLTYNGTNIASSEENLALIYASAPEGKTAANIAYFYVVNGEVYEASAYVYAAASELYTVNYGKITKSYLVGEYFVPEKITLDICTPVFDIGGGTATLPLNWIGLAAEGILDASFGGVTVVAEFDLEGENQVFDLSFYIFDFSEKKTAAYGLADSENVGADLAAALSALQSTVYNIYFYQDIAAPALTVNVECTFDLNGHALTLGGTFTANRKVEFFDGSLLSAAKIPFAVSTEFVLGDVNVYLSSADVVISGTENTQVSVSESSIYVLGNAIPLVTGGALAAVDSKDPEFPTKLVNVILDSNVLVLGGTVIGTEGTFAGCSYRDGVTANIKVNNNTESITVLGETYVIVYAEAASNVASDFVTVNYVYAGVIRGTDIYLVGSIPSFYKEFTTGYYFEYIGTYPLSSNADINCTFHADASKLKSQVVLTDALNYIFYLQVEDAGVLANLNINGVAIDLATLKQVEMDGAMFYVIPVDFEIFEDVLDEYELSVDLVGEGTSLTITAYASLYEYFAAALATAEAEEAELIYTVAEYVVALADYFDYDFFFSDIRLKNLGRLNNLLAAYAEYRVELPALPEGTDVTSDYIIGALLVAKEKVTFAFHVADGFAGTVKINGVNVVLEKPFDDFDRTYVLLEVSFADLDEQISLSVEDADGMVLESLNYTLADYIAGVVAQNEGVAADYAKALWKLAAVVG